MKRMHGVLVASAFATLGCSAAWPAAGGAGRAVRHVRADVTARPGAGGVESSATSVLSRESRADTTKPAGAATTWYEPGPDDPRSHAEERRPNVHATPLAMGLAYDLRGFVSGRPRGTAHEIRALIGKGIFGGSIGVHVPSGRLGLGLEIGRHWGVPLGLTVRKSELFLVFPTVEPRLLLSLTAGDEIWRSAILAIGTSGFGVRAVRLPFATEIRLPTLHILGLPFNGRGSVAVEAGISLAAHYTL